MSSNCFSVHWHFLPEKNPNNWYFDQMFYDVEQGLDCCSALPVEIHDVKNIKEIYLLEYLIYKVDVFGINLYKNETLPEKFTMTEILQMANIQSNSNQWEQHDIYHQMDSDEFF